MEAGTMPRTLRHLIRRRQFGGASPWRLWRRAVACGDLAVLRAVEGTAFNLYIYGPGPEDEIEGQLTLAQIAGQSGVSVGRLVSDMEADVRNDLLWWDLEGAATPTAVWVALPEATDPI